MRNIDKLKAELKRLEAAMLYTYAGYSANAALPSGETICFGRDGDNEGLFILVAGQRMGTNVQDWNRQTCLDVISVLDSVVKDLEKAVTSSDAAISKACSDVSALIATVESRGTK